MEMKKAGGCLTFNSGVEEVSLKSTYGEVILTNVGAAVVSIKMPDRLGKLENVVLGFKHAKDYLINPFYLGSTLGRVAGRISSGKFSMGNQNISLLTNDNSGNHLHGGIEGFSQKIFKIGNLYATSDSAGVEFYYCSENKEEGYPGKLELTVKYILDKNNLKISYEAFCDAPTPLNLSNHCYFNLSGKKEQSLNQELFIEANSILETDENFIPTGKIKDIRNTAYDFRIAKAIKSNKDKLDHFGYNDYFILDNTSDLAAVLYDDISGRRITIKTSYPGVLFYSGDYLENEFQSCEGICLEAQHYPDAVNNENFPNIILEPGQFYQNYINYIFSV